MSVSCSSALHHFLGHGNRRLTSALLPESCSSSRNASTSPQHQHIIHIIYMCVCNYMYISLSIYIDIIMVTSSVFIIADIQLSDTSPEVLVSKADKALAHFSTSGSVWQQELFSTNNSQNMATNYCQS